MWGFLSWRRYVIDQHDSLGGIGNDKNIRSYGYPQIKSVTYSWYPRIFIIRI